MSDEKLTLPPAPRAAAELDLLPPWYLPEGRFEELPGILSSTDLLAAWQPDVVAPLSGSAPEAMWDVFFEGRSALVDGTLAEASDAGTEAWNPAAAASAVDCFFRFLHALERWDVEAAMLCVSSDYHLVEHDREIDRIALRSQLERLLDEWRGPELRISPTEIPDPVFYRQGILLHTTLQVDFEDRATGRPATRLLAYLIHLDAARGQEYLIHVMHRIV